jgi:hypothetical protein
MSIARTTTSAASEGEMRASRTIISFADRLMAETSVGLKASATLNESAARA